MSRKLNCWEFKNCGRGRGGIMIDTLGTCPIAEAMQCDGLNGGIAAGRVCWTVHADGNRLCGYGLGPRKSCLSCDFYRRVVHEEAENACHRFSSIVEPDLK